MQFSYKPRGAVSALGIALAVALSGPVFAQDSAQTPDASQTAPTTSTEGANRTEGAGATVSGDGHPRNEVGDKFELPRYSEGNQIELITGLCAIQLKNMSKASCTCLAERSMDDLSDPQRDYLIASVVAPPVADRMLNDGRVGDADQSEIFGFLQATSETCRTQEDGAAPATAPDAAPSGETDQPAQGAN